LCILNKIKFNLIVLFTAALSLTACMETASDLNMIRQIPESKQTPLQVQIQAPQIPVMLISLEGAPDVIIAQFNVALANEAKRRNIFLASDKAQARFKLKGYISAYNIQGGTSLSWVWDVYDSQAQRAQRLDGAQTIKRTEADPWAAIDEATLKLAASIAMNDVANYLSNAKQDQPLQSKNTPQTPANKALPAGTAIEPAIAADSSAPKFSALDLRR
jgi:hypothetical protein